jgi:hypothetical protein
MIAVAFLVQPLIFLDPFSNRTRPIVCLTVNLLLVPSGLITNIVLSSVGALEKCELPGGLQSKLQVLDSNLLRTYLPFAFPF